MAVKIRLKRFGKRGKPIWRLVAIEEGKKRQGREIEVFGFYDPNSNPAKVNCSYDRINYWLKVGAQCSDTVSHLIKKAQLNLPSKKK